MSRAATYISTMLLGGALWLGGCGYSTIGCNSITDSNNNLKRIQDINNSQEYIKDKMRRYFPKCPSLLNPIETSYDEETQSDSAKAGQLEELSKKYKRLSSMQDSLYSLNDVIRDNNRIHEITGKGGVASCIGVLIFMYGLANYTSYKEKTYQRE